MKLPGPRHAPGTSTSCRHPAGAPSPPALEKTMQEVYLFENTGQIQLKKAGAEPGVDPQLLQAAQNENFNWLEPMFAGGDTELVYLTVFRQPNGPGGLVVVFAAGNEPLFSVIARTNLDLISAASHFGSMVANVRYGQDIFENVDAED